MTEVQASWVGLLANAVALALGWVVFRYLLEPGFVRSVALIVCEILGAIYALVLLYLAVCEVVIWRRGLKQ